MAPLSGMRYPAFSLYSIIMEIDPSLQQPPRPILELSKEEKRNFIDSFDLILNDCDGVIWNFTGPLDGAKEGLHALKRINKRIAFVSNNSYFSKETYEEKFSGLEVNFDYNQDLLHPAAATVTYLKSINFQGLIYLIASDPFRHVLVENGIQCISMPNPMPVMNSLEELFQVIFSRLPSPVSAVIYDVDLNFNLTKFYAAEYCLSRSSDCLLIYGANDKWFRSYDHVFAGVGVFMEALQERVGRKPLVLGKPGQELRQIVLNKFRVKDPSRVLFVGDTLKQDIGFANECGFQSLLVLSGATTQEMLKDHQIVGEIPKFYTESLFDFVEFFKEF